MVGTLRFASQLRRCGMISRCMLLFALLWPVAAFAGDYAASEVRIVCDRWPDAGTPATFGRDAIRLAGAKSAEEKAIAVWRFIQQTTTVGSVVPKEPAYGNSYVISPEKLLNVYGVHWCDGLTRIMTNVWRALGYRADKLYSFGHTLANIHYPDDDGVERWHVFDLSQHWYAYDRKGSHIATPDELALDHSLVLYPARTPLPDVPSLMQPSWVHAGHLDLKPHPMGLNLRNGERIEFSWGNEGKPYLDLFPKGVQTDFEHGPYPLTYGNGRLITPMANPLGDTGEKVISVALPYIISDVALSFSGWVADATAPVILSISTDEGRNWREVWTSDSAGGFTENNFNICSRFNPLEEHQINEITPFGRYNYWLKATRVGHGSRLDDLKITTTFQHNYFALPMLWPGQNRMSASGLLTETSRLRITFRWDDASGEGRENTTEVANLPGFWQVETEGPRWETVRCRSLVLEVVPAAPSTVGAGTVTSEIAAKSPESGQTPLPYPSARSIGSKERKLPSLVKAIRDIEQELNKPSGTTEDVVADRLLVLAAYGDPNVAPLLERVIREDVSSHVKNKIRACQALYRSTGNGATNMMVELLLRNPNISWRPPDTKWTSDTQWLHVGATAVAILRQVKDFDRRDQVADMIALTLDGRMTTVPLEKIYRGEEIGWGLVRALGDLGNRRHVPLLLALLGKKGDVGALAAEALGKIGDPAVLPVLVEKLETAEYQPLLKALIIAIGGLGTQKNGQQLYRFLGHWDEDLRHAAAQALAILGDRNAHGLIAEAAQKEPFPWVRESMRASLAGGGSY